jgi:alpha-tubulin suppressor-like RCC1 family protein
LVSVGDGTACAVKEGAVYCWGAFNSTGQLGNGSLSGSFTPVPVPTLASGVAEVSVGATFVCARTTAGAALCWGDGALGTLGNGQLTLSLVPVQVKGLTSGVLALSAGEASVTAILADGRVVAWGFGEDGELGNTLAEVDSGVEAQGGLASPVPITVKGLTSPAVSVSTGQAPCVATKAGTIECWGIIAENALTPVPVMTLDAITSLTAGGELSTGQFACAVDPNIVPSFFCWGGNGAGQLGAGMPDETLPIEVTAILTPGATQVSAGVDGDFACGIASSLAYCWGDNSSGQLGNGTTVSGETPSAVVGLTGNVTAIATGHSSACAVVTPKGDAGPDAGVGGVLYCWGDNTYGELGTGSTAPSMVPIEVTALGSHVASVSVGIDFACAILDDGTVDCWGSNAAGQLGNGTTTTTYLPTPISGVTEATAISAGWYSACAVAHGEVECWGDNSYGELGSGTFDSSPVPVPVLAPTGLSRLFGATEVAIGTLSACAVVSGGVYCWGAGPFGNDSPPGLAMNVSAPVVGLAGVTTVAVANEFACAGTATGAYCWGYNTAGQLGNGGAVDAFKPQPIKGFP